jgi:phosphoglycerate dehydrogenase-like enzyme
MIEAPFVDEVLTGESGLNKLLTKSDYLVIAAALTTETRHLIGEPQLAMMKPGSVLINIARGGLVDEPVLIDALRLGRIGGAILDVFSTEPLPLENPLWDMPNVVVSPHHSGGGTVGLRKRQVEIFAENVRRYVSDRPLLNVVDIVRGY